STSDRPSVTMAGPEPVTVHPPSFSVCSICIAPSIDSPDNTKATASVTAAPQCRLTDCLDVSIPSARDVIVCSPLNPDLRPRHNIVQLASIR
ncbi:hypothetical protein HMPREF0298_2301, partial [Corynebacterium lipophiloflavum DSM 44291]